MTMNASPFAMNIKVPIKPERREEFLRIIQNDQKQTLETEPEALQFVIGEDIDEPNTFYLHEQYTSKDGFAEHEKTAHFADLAKFVGTEPFSSPPVIEKYDGTHEAEKIPVRSAFCLNVELCIKPEVREEFLKVIQNNQKGSTETEPLCYQYHWGESTATPNTFYFHEQYGGSKDGEEGFEAHANAPHFAAWEDFASTNPFTKDPVVSKFKTI